MIRTLACSIGLVAMAACAATPADTEVDAAVAAPVGEDSLAGAAATDGAEPVDPAADETAQTTDMDALGAKVRRADSYTESYTEASGDRIICKTRQATGSRIRKEKICGTEAEWRMKDNDNDRFHQELTSDRAASNSR